MNHNLVRLFYLALLSQTVDCIEWLFPLDSTILQLPGDRDVHAQAIVVVPPLATSCPVATNSSIVLDSDESPFTLRQHATKPVRTTFTITVGAHGTHGIAIKYSTKCYGETVWNTKLSSKSFEAAPSAAWLLDELLPAPDMHTVQPVIDVSDTVLSLPGSSTYAVAFLTDLTDPFDGMKQIFLQQILALVSTEFKPFIVDTSCTPPGSFAETVKSHNVPVKSICIELDAARFGSVDNFITTMDIQLKAVSKVAPFGWSHERLVEKDRWVESVYSRIPNDLQSVVGIRELIETLISTDVFVTPNSYMLGTQFMVEIARISGVHSRVMDLGSLGITRAIIPGLRKLTIVNRGSEGNESSVNVLLSPSKYFFRHKLLQNLFRDRLIPPMPLYWLPGKVDTNVFHPPRSIRLPPDSTIFRILFVGNLRPEKGTGLLIKAFSMLVRENGTPSCLDIVGDGKLREPLWDLGIRAANLNMTVGEPCSKPGQVSFLGAIPHEQLPGVFQNSDVYAFPSYPETLGFVALEAMASGLPVVAHGLGGSEDFLGDECTGKFASELTPEAFKEALEFEMKLWNGDRIETHCNNQRLSFQQQRINVQRVTQSRYSNFAFQQRTRNVYRSMVLNKY